MLGSTISHYRVLRQLGRGGMGEVYEAEDLTLGRRLALKFLPESSAPRAETWERFQREARVIAALNHPHILTIYEIGNDAARSFIATELVEGKTLRELLMSGPLPETQAIPVMRQILEALKAAHAAGIIHRDLKPENIMVRSDGYVKVLDFGVAKLRPGTFDSTTVDASITQAGEMIGTALYMAPEQLRGETIDARADIFAAGIVFHEIVTGKYPWQRDSVLDTLHAILHDEPDSESSLAGDLAVPIFTALCKQPSQRYPSAEAMLAALEKAGSGMALHMPAQPSPPSIAVLPFSFLGEAEDKQALSLGFADALITTLGTLENVIVRPTSAILRHSETHNAIDTANALRVRYVLHGNIQKIGNAWRVSIQLFDAQANRIVFAEKYDFSMAGVFEIQDEISRRVALSLERRLGSGATQARYSRNTQAYDDYLHGLRNSYGDVQVTLEKAVQDFSRAVASDPGFALAHAMLSQVCLTLYFGHDPRRHWLAQAESACRRSLELDPGLAEALMAKAYITWSPAKNFQHREALYYLQQALARQPNLDHALNRLGTICSHIGRMPESLAAHRKAQQVNPFNFGFYNSTQTLLWSGQWQEAEPLVERWVAENPHNKYAYWVRPQPALFSGDIETATRLMGDALRRCPDDPMFISLEGLLCAWRGETEAALRCVQRSCESPQWFGHTHHTHYQIASTYAVLGKTEEAMAWLERAVDSGFPCWPLFRLDPSLRSLHSVPRFVELVDGLEQEFRDIDLAL